jgi:hypothetical protein
VVAAGAYLAQTIGAVVPKISEVVGVARRMQVWLEPGSPVTN